MEETYEKLLYLCQEKYIGCLYVNLQELSISQERVFLKKICIIFAHNMQCLSKEYRVDWKR